MKGSPLLDNSEVTKWTDEMLSSVKKCTYAMNKLKLSPLLYDMLTKKPALHRAGTLDVLLEMLRYVFAQSCAQFGVVVGE